jgi:aminoglycoside 6'-N-acetyltransferase
MVTFHTERTTIRPFAEDDIAPTLAMLAEPEVSRWWGVYDSARVHREFMESKDAVSFAIEVDAAFAGVVQYWVEAEPEYRHAGLDITLATAYHDAGLGPEVLRSLATYLFEELDFHRLVIDPAADNARAIRAYEKIGYRPVGIMRQYEQLPDGSWRDALLMDMLKGELR